MVLPQQRACHKSSPEGNLEWYASKGCILVSSRRAVFAVIGQDLKLEPRELWRGRGWRGRGRDKALRLTSLASPD